MAECRALRAFPLWLRRRDVRVAVVLSFPYTLIFAVEGNVVVLYAVAHDKRRPATGATGSARRSDPQERDALVASLPAASTAEHRLMIRSFAQGDSDSEVEAGAL